jgi:hypothetical protein
MSDPLDLTTRDLTTEELAKVPTYFKKPYFSLDDNLIHVTWNEDKLTSPNGKFPWKYLGTDDKVSKDDFEEAYPGYNKFDKGSYDHHNLEAKYDGKTVRWSNKRTLWVYKNNRKVVFPDSDEEGSELSPPPSTDQEDSETEHAEVSGLLEKTTQAVTAAIASLSRAHTPQSPGGILPGTLPSSPGPSSPPPHPLFTPRQP